MFIKKHENYETKAHKENWFFSLQKKIEIIKMAVTYQVIFVFRGVIICIAIDIQMFFMKRAQR